MTLSTRARIDASLWVVQAPGHPYPGIDSTTSSIQHTWIKSMSSATSSLMLKVKSSCKLSVGFRSSGFPGDRERPGSRLDLTYLVS
jgi:hypothetical protein